MSNQKYMDTKDVAKVIRKRLKTTFPGVKFSVTISRYSMGSSVSIRWTDGPSAKMVDEITSQYNGSGFDGMIDMSYNITHWLLPDGSATIAHTSGTEGSRGVVPAINNPAPHPDAILCSFGSSHISTSRKMSAKLVKAQLEITAKKWHFDASEYEIEPECEYGSAHIKNGGNVQIAGEWLSQLVWRTAGDICQIDPAWKVGKSDAWEQTA